MSDSIRKADIKKQRNRESTEASIIAAVGSLVEDSGFENLGINAVAAKAGVSKMLIYRYFDSMDGLITAYIRQYDFWINYNEPVPDAVELTIFVGDLFRRQALQMRNNNTLRKFYRWELSTFNEHIRRLREQREEAGIKLVKRAAQLSGVAEEKIAAIATIFSAAISYLTLLSENCDVYNGIPIQDDRGWLALEECMNEIFACINYKWSGNAL
jgi:AcrR family transcriptional regulator